MKTEILERLATSVPDTGLTIAMFNFPTPLHPAIVHFPIAFVLLGSGLAVLSAALNRSYLRWIVAVLLSLASIACFVATQTGETADQLLSPLPPGVDVLHEAHEKWAERAEAASAVAAVLAIATVVASALSERRNAGGNSGSAAEGTQGTAKRFPLAKLALGLRAITAAAAMTTGYFIAETGHAGGKLVYEYGIGMKQTNAQAAQPTPLARSHRD